MDMEGSITRTWRSQHVTQQLVFRARASIASIARLVCVVPDHPFILPNTVNHTVLLTANPMLSYAVPLTASEYLTGTVAGVTNASITIGDDGLAARKGLQLADGTPCTCLGPLARQCGRLVTRSGKPYVVVRVSKSGSGATRQTQGGASTHPSTAYSVARFARSFGHAPSGLRC